METDEQIYIKGSFSILLKFGSTSEPSAQENIHLAPGQETPERIWEQHFKCGIKYMETNGIKVVTPNAVSNCNFYKMSVSSRNKSSPKIKTLNCWGKELHPEHFYLNLPNHEALQHFNITKTQNEVDSFTLSSTNKSHF